MAPALFRNAPSAASSAPAQGSGYLQSAIERLPPLNLLEIRPGDTILVAGSNGDDPSRVTAITILAGAESLLRSEGGKSLDLGSWNLDLNMGVGVPGSATPQEHGKKISRRYQ